jgi:hypothetical protein
MHAEVRAAFGKSFARWRQGKSQPKIDERRAACAMSIAEDKRMHAGDREDMVIEALLYWLRERILISRRPDDPWPVHLIIDF